MMSKEPALELLATLREHLGDLVVTSTDVLEAMRGDKSGKTSEGLPLCLVEPLTTEQVSTVLKIASQTKTPVVTRGAGSGLAGGAVGGPGEIVLSMAKMNQILQLSKTDRTALVEAGVINQDLDTAAKKLGMWFAPDPASRSWSTVGGNIATNAGGLLCAKYGVTRESVLQLTVVLADGTVLEVGHQSIKGVSGYDLVSLFVGSEGTLGVITKARVRLRPSVSYPVWTIHGTAQGVDLLAEAVEATIAAGLQPSILELIDERCTEHIAKFLGRDAHAGSAMLIAQTDGADSGDMAAEIRQLWERLGLTAESGVGRDDLLQFRRAMHPALESSGNVLIEDVAVPISQLRNMFCAIREIETDYGLEIPTVAHAGDGNLHPNFVYTEDQVPEKIWRAADALFRKAIEFGGTLTGEHGVGILKRQWLADELGPDQYRLQLGLKKLFDPNNILNPGKVF